MNALAPRRPPPPRGGPRLPRRVRQARPALRQARRPGRRWRLIALLACVALALWALWPAAPQVEPATAPPAKAATSRAPTTKPASVAASRLKLAQPPSPLRARRDLLLAAIRARAATLRPCVPRDASELDVPVRLHVTRAGAVKALDFTGSSPPHSVAECLRGVASGWNFQDVELPADVELFATLALGPGA